MAGLSVTTASVLALAGAAGASEGQSIYDFTVNFRGKEVPLSKFRG